MNARISARTWQSIALVAAAACTLQAQEPAAIRKTVLPNLDSQVRASVVALDERLNAVHAPHLAAGLFGQAAVPLPQLGLFAPILTDPRNNEIWEQLPDEYYRLTQESGDALVTLADLAPPFGSAWCSDQVRRLCHRRLAALPRSSLALYRQRVDAEAKALLEQGKDGRNPAPLRRLVDDLFCSSHADQALDLLGDLAFERGDFDEARHWWSMLVPLEELRGDQLRYPDPRVDLVRVEAKQILGLMFGGRLKDAERQTARFRARHPLARGHLAGGIDFYGKTLDKTLGELARTPLAGNDEPWTTFGGDSGRNRALSLGAGPQLWEDGPAWRVALPTLSYDGKDKLPTRGTLKRRLAFHPVIVNNQVLIADHRSVNSYHLTTGKELFRYDLKTAGLSDPGPGVDARAAMPRFTLTADPHRAYVRLGGLGIGSKRDAGPSYLVCLDLTHPEQTRKRELWHVKADAYFEGSPLVHDGRVYIALSKAVGPRTLTSIVCYDLLGRQRWAREVCDAPEFEGTSQGPRYREHLLTLAAGQVVYCSHAGAIVAVDAWTGQPTWGVRYVSRGARTVDGNPSPRDLAPCVHADSRFYAAPLDSDRVFCLDALTGHLRWESDPVEVVHLLGVADGQVLTSTRDGLQAFDAGTGLTTWRQPAQGRLPSLGRGLIADPWLIWPTQDPLLPIRAIAITDGAPAAFDPTRFSQMPVGNMALGHGCLAVAGLHELVVFAPAKGMGFPLDVRPLVRVDGFADFAVRSIIIDDRRRRIR